MWAIIDIDHTLAKAAWRDDLLGDWDAYHSASDKDDPVECMKVILGALDLDGLTLVAITARPEKWRMKTMCWLVKHEFAITTLVMRPDHDYRPAPEVKVEQAEFYKDNEGKGEAPLFIIDNDDRVISAFRALGIPTFQISI